MMGEPHWVKDNFLSDFLFDTDQIEREPEDAASWEGSDLDFMPADDASLSSYLSGEVCSGSGRGDRISCKSVKPVSVSSVSPEPISLSEDDEVSTMQSQSVSRSQRPILVVTRPPPSKRNSNSRQAVAARENRQKKKQYLSGLEASVQKFSEENEQLKKQDAEQKQLIAELKEEVMYLKSVIANESALSALLKNIQNTDGVKLSASLLAEAGDNSHLGVTRPASGQKRKLPSCLTKKGNYEITSSQDFPEKRSRPIASKAGPPPDRWHGHQQQMSLNSNSFGVIQTGDDDMAEPTVSVSLKLNAKAPLHGKTTEAVQASVDSNCGISGNDAGLGGICLHVLGDSVSVEFCSSCNRSAVRSCSTDHAYVKAQE